MPLNRPSDFDVTDRALIAALQEDGRRSTADLAREVSLSPSATAERLRRLTDAGVIAGITAVIDPEAVGYPVQASIRLGYPTGNYKPFHDVVDSTPEIIEAHHVTGADCFFLKVIARSMRDLERIAGRVATLGTISTSVIYSSPLPRRTITAAS